MTCWKATKSVLEQNKKIKLLNVFWCEFTSVTNLLWFCFVFWKIFKHWVFLLMYCTDFSLTGLRVFFLNIIIFILLQKYFHSLCIKIYKLTNLHWKFGWITKQVYITAKISFAFFFCIFLFYFFAIINLQLHELCFFNWEILFIKNFFCRKFIWKSIRKQKPSEIPLPRDIYL